MSTRQAGGGDDQRAAKENAQSSCDEAIAIIGMSCRFPGGSNSPELLWDLLSRGGSAWSGFPKDRLNIDGFWHPSAERQDGFTMRGAHFIDGNVKAWDADFFQTTKQEADAIDPQHRVLMEVAYQALENAGLPKEKLNGSWTGVYVGSFVKDYEQIVLRDSQDTPVHGATGTGTAMMSNRISYSLDLKGPSMTIDTGCSASLVCVNQACMGLLMGQSDLAIAGGAGMILTPATIMPMNSLGFLSPEGKCYTFDSRANGYGRGEGVGIIILKRLSDAIRDNDTIRAVIRGTACGQDGRTAGITLPSKEAQMACIHKAYANSKLDFSKTAFVECHGTGTKAGDWREVSAIAETLGKVHDADNPIIVGSLKTNIGHLEGSAGVAGVIKTVLALEKGIIPRHINFEKPNPDIEFAKWNVKVPVVQQQWPVEGLRRASVNCFGFGGTNAHVILDDAENYLKERSIVAHHNTIGITEEVSEDAEMSDGAPLLFTYSANDKDGIARIAKAHISYASSLPDSMLPDYAYTLFSRRSKLDYKAYIVASSSTELSQKLQEVDSGSAIRHGSREARIALVFCGQGAQWARMGSEMMALSHYADSIRAASEYMKSLDEKFCLLDHLLGQAGPSGGQTSIDGAAVAQPATTAVQVALVDCLRALQVPFGAVVGHSSGEIAAAYAAGVLSREDAWLVAFARGAAAASLRSVSPPLPRGGMLAVGLSAAEAEALLEQRVRSGGRRGAVQIACFNTPRLVTLSGDGEEIDQVKRLVDAADAGGKSVFCRLLPVDTAYHSAHMLSVEGVYREKLAALGFRASPAPVQEQHVRFFSSLAGEELADKSILTDASYWVDNMVSPVRFEDAVTAMMLGSRPPNVFIEVSPSAIWGHGIKQIVDHLRLREQPTHLPLMKRGTDGMATFMNALGQLFVRNIPIDMDAAVFGRNTSATSMHKSSSRPARQLPKCLVDIPPYPFNHSQTYWHETEQALAHRMRRFGRRDYIGAPMGDSVPNEPRWRGFFRMHENPWMHDHQVQKSVLYPAAGMVAMAIEAASQVASETIDNASLLVDYEVCDFKIKKAIVIAESGRGVEHMLSAKKRNGETPAVDDGITTLAFEFSIYTKAEGEDWVENASGLFVIRHKTDGDASVPVDNDTGAFSRSKVAYAVFLGKSESQEKPAEFYGRLEAIGMNYGPLFQNVTSISAVDVLDEEEALRGVWTTIRTPDTKSTMPEEYEYPHIIHPATLDAMLHTIFALEEDAMVPHCIDSVRVLPSIPHGAGHEFFGFSRAKRVGVREGIADITMFLSENNERPAVVIKGLKATTLSNPTIRGRPVFLPSHRNLCSTIVWEKDVSRHASQANTFPEFLDMLAHKYPDMTILQIGDNASLTGLIFSQLTEAGIPRCARFALYSDRKDADIGPSTSEAATDAQWSELLTVDQMATEDILASQPFDLVILNPCNRIDSECDNKGVGYEQIVKLIKPGGFLVSSCPSMTNAVQPLCQSLNFGDGWSVSESRQGECGIDEAKLFARSRPDRATTERQLIAKNIVVLVPTDSDNRLMDSFIRHLVGKGIAPGGILVLPLGQLRKQAHQIRLKPTICISFLDFAALSSAERNFMFDILPENFDFLKMILGIFAGVLWITDGAQAGGCDPRAAIFHGLSRAIRSENEHQRKCTVATLDFHRKASGLHIRDEKLWQCVTDMITDTFSDVDTSGAVVKETGARPRDYEFMCTEGTRYIPRLKPLTDLNTYIEKGKVESEMPTSIEDREQPLRLSSTGCYLLVGGLGGLGKEIALQLAGYGAKKLAFFSRSAGSGREDQAFVDTLARKGVNAFIKMVDICDMERLEMALKEVRDQMGAIRGVVHAAAVIEDGIWDNMTHEKWTKAARVKTVGSWNLHTLIPQSSIDFFMFLSSAAGVIGNRGQANYAAANVFQDALAQYRTESVRAKLPYGSSSTTNGAGEANTEMTKVEDNEITGTSKTTCVSIDLGPVTGAGMLAQDDATMAILRQSGFVGVRLRDVRYIVERAIRGHGASPSGPQSALPSQIVLGVGTGGLMLQNRPADPFWTRTAPFALLNRIDLPESYSASSAGGPVDFSASVGAEKHVRALLAAAADRESAASIILQGLLSAMAKILNVVPERVDPVRQTTSDLGSDSLRDAEFSSWIVRATGVIVSAAEIGTHRLASLADIIASRGDFGGAGTGSLAAVAEGI